MTQTLPTAFTERLRTLLADEYDVFARASILTIPPACTICRSRARCPLRNAWRHSTKQPACGPIGYTGEGHYLAKLHKSMDEEIIAAPQKRKEKRGTKSAPAGRK